MTLKFGVKLFPTDYIKTSIPINYKSKLGQELILIFSDV